MYWEASLTFPLIFYIKYGHIIVSSSLWDIPLFLRQDTGAFFPLHFQQGGGKWLRPEMKRTHSTLCQMMLKHLHHPNSPSYYLVWSLMIGLTFSIMSCRNKGREGGRERDRERERDIHHSPLCFCRLSIFFVPPLSSFFARPCLQDMNKWKNWLLTIPLSISALRFFFFLMSILINKKWTVTVIPKHYNKIERKLERLNQTSMTIPKYVQTVVAFTR